MNGACENDHSNNDIRPASTILFPRLAWLAIAGTRLRPNCFRKQSLFMGGWGGRGGQTNLSLHFVSQRKSLLSYNREIRFPKIIIDISFPSHFSLFHRLIVA